MRQAEEQAEPGVPDLLLKLIGPGHKREYAISAGLDAVSALDLITENMF